MRCSTQRLATGAIDMLQLHGAETPERVAAIKARTGKPVMKVIKVAEAGDVERGIAAYAAVADRLMFDAADGMLPGGNARAFDWTILSRPYRAAAVAPGGRPHARQRRRGGARHGRARRRRFLWRRIEPGCEIDRLDPRLPRPSEGALRGARA